MRYGVGVPQKLKNKRPYDPGKTKPVKLINVLYLIQKHFRVMSERVKKNKNRRMEN